jgi:putative transposase
MRKTYKYRLFPNNPQRKALENTLDLCRWVYNKTLEMRRTAWQERQESLSRYDTIKMLPEWKAEKPSLTDVHSQVLQEVCTRVELAFKAFFRRVKAGETPGYPRFRSYGRYDSFTYPQSGFKWLASDGKWVRLRLSKIGDVKIRLHRSTVGTIKTLTVQRDRLGNWYACFSCEVDSAELPPTKHVVGVDLGLSTFATMSDGNTIKRQRWMKRDAKELKRISRKVSALAKGSPERRKAVRALNHVHVRIAHRRKDFVHQESRKVIDTYQVIALEKLGIKDMQSNGNKIVNRGIGDVAWSQFVQACLYKAEEAGRTVVLVDPCNTTKECSGCGEIVPKTLSERVHKCDSCGLTMHRDLNASINILRRGLASLDSVVEAHVL